MKKFDFRNLKTSNYFEGWYLRITDELKNVNLAFIFAVTKDVDDPHSFIQIYDGISLTNKYYRFDISDFRFINKTVSIKNNFLSLENMYINIKEFEIDISLESIKNIKMKHSEKSAMSYMSKFPLECFQEVNIIDGVFKGNITINKEIKSISGKTYLEKTYGNKFPQEWIWLQSNHFDKEAALTFAYGKIPFIKWKVNGFFSILIINGIEYRFASYNFARIKINKVSDTKAIITLKRGFHKLVLSAKMIHPVVLVGPVENGKMILDVFESINSLVSLTLYKRNKVIFESKGRNVGFELVI
jgi:hypothetical protein